MVTLVATSAMAMMPPGTALGLMAEASSSMMTG